ISALAGRWEPEAGSRKSSRPLTNNVINNTVFLALVGSHDVVPFRIVLDTLERLARMLSQDLVQPLTGSEQFPGVDIDVGRLPPQALDPRLVDQDPGVG